jgi:integrating conjugative element relaxase (TIGR03760 family)
VTDVLKGISEALKTRKENHEQKKVVSQDAVPILSADQLLSTEKRQQMISDIQGLLNLPEEEYKKIFLKAAENFAEFVQNLPETERSYYAAIGGMLDHGLERASLSLFLCRTYLLSEEVTLASVSEKEMLWVYAVYTAALFFDIGKIPTKHTIHLTDEAGDTLKVWMPYEGSMTRENASHYAGSFSEDPHDHMRWMVTPLLASIIIPKEGLLWLASDPDVFNAWLGLLSGEDQRQVGSILTVIPLADAQLLESYFTDRKVFRHNLSPQTIALLAKFQKERKALLQRQKELREKLLAAQVDKTDEQPLDKNADKDKKVTRQSLFGFPSVAQQDRQTLPLIMHDTKELTQRFIQWVQKNVDTINRREALIQTAEKGVLIDVKVLQKFIAENKIVQLTTAELQKVIVQTEIARPAVILKAQQSGQTPALLVNNTYLLFPGGPPPSLAALMGNSVQSQQIDPQQQTPGEKYRIEQPDKQMHTMPAPRLIK